MSLVFGVDGLPEAAIARCIEGADDQGAMLSVRFHRWLDVLVEHRFEQRQQGIGEPLKRAYRLAIGIKECFIRPVPSAPDLRM